eukprot:8313438-Alexandrium_andersonii.AAC.1
MAAQLGASVPSRARLAHQPGFRLAPCPGSSCMAAPLGAAVSIPGRQVQQPGFRPMRCEASQRTPA